MRLKDDCKQSAIEALLGASVNLAIAIRLLILGPKPADIRQAKDELRYAIDRIDLAARLIR